MQYKGALHEMGKKTRQEEELEKSKVWMIVQNDKQFSSFVSNTQASYAQFYNSLDLFVKLHGIPSVGSLTETKNRN